jgi:hypothetical protein
VDPLGGVPRTLVQLSMGPTKIFSNRSSTAEGGLALMEDKVKEQVAGLELGTMLVLCGNSALHTHIPNIVVFVHQDHRMEVTTGKLVKQPAGADVTKLETSMSFLQIKTSMGLHKKIRQIRHEICQNRREMAQVRLEAIAGADNPYSLHTAGVWQRPCHLEERGRSIHEEVQSGRDAASGQPQLHRGDPGDTEQHQPLRRPHQLPHQVVSLAYQV